MIIPLICVALSNILWCFLYCSVSPKHISFSLVYMCMYVVYIYVSVCFCSLCLYVYVFFCLCCYMFYVVMSFSVLYICVCMLSTFMCLFVSIYVIFCLCCLMLWCPYMLYVNLFNSTMALLIMTRGNSLDAQLLEN